MTDRKASSWSHAVEAAVDAAFAPIHAGVDRVISERAELLAALKKVDVLLSAVVMSTDNGAELIGPEALDVLEVAAEVAAVIAKCEGR
jgi:hypothetical protein